MKSHLPFGACSLYASFPKHPENGTSLAFVPAWQPGAWLFYRNTLQFLQALPEKLQIRDGKW